ncbi:hypothetical protein JVU11DRAFT_7553 [Chiua virens]|nr:hypothetical protein JVU11DRAFT_7553 [Chiua virens]
MAHNCLDWSSNPPTRKIPLLVLTRGNDQVYTPVPQEFEASRHPVLEQVARKEFHLGDAKIFFSSSCVNLCNWPTGKDHGKHMGASQPFHRMCHCGGLSAQSEQLGKSTAPRLDVAREEQPTSSEVTRPGKQPDSPVQGTLPSSTNQLDGHENEPSEQGLGSKPDNSAGDVVRDQRDVPLGHGKDQNIPTGQHEKIREGNAILSPKSRIRRRAVVSEGEEEGGTEESERERKVPSESQVLPGASPNKPTQSSKEIKERGDHQLSQRDSQHESDERLYRPNKRIKQEKDASESENRPSLREEASQPRTGAQSEYPLTQAQAEPSDKLTIRVAHRLSKQESKFTVKGTTSVTKVLAGVCKSFCLNVDRYVAPLLRLFKLPNMSIRTNLYLIVSTEEDGEEENLFPCDKHDSISRAGAERDIESKFLVKVAGEA